MSCPFHDRLQDHLDGLLAPAEADALLDHLEHCAECSAERLRYERVFARLESAALFDPGPAFTERVLDAVLPGRVRRRWLRTLGFGYAAAAALTAAGVTLVLANPGARAALGAVGGAASREMVHGMVAVLGLGATAVLRLGQGLGLAQGTLDRLAPFARVFGSILTEPTLAVAMSVATAAAAGVLWLMRPRARHATREIRHVGILAF